MRGHPRRRVDCRAAPNRVSCFREGEAPAEPRSSGTRRLGRSLALPERSRLALPISRLALPERSRLALPEGSCLAFDPPRGRVKRLRIGFFTLPPGGSAVRNERPGRGGGEKPTARKCAGEDYCRSRLALPILCLALPILCLALPILCLALAISCLALAVSCYAGSLVAYLPGTRSAIQGNAPPPRPPGGRPRARRSEPDPAPDRPRAGAGSSCDGPGPSHRCPQAAGGAIAASGRLARNRSHPGRVLARMGGGQVHVFGPRVCARRG